MINVIGLGYIGLPTALMLSKGGLHVVGTDINQSVVDNLNQGKIHFDEPGINALFKEAQKNHISFTTKYQSTNLYIITVPTPYIDTSKKLDPTFVIKAVKQTLEVCDRGSIIVIESTIAPGSIDQYIRPIMVERGLQIGHDIHLVHAPERIIPGNMIYELENNSRTIGADDLEIAKKIKNIYESFCHAEIVLTDIRSAEMSKVVENTFRDVNIAFANELAKICRESNLDVYEIIRIANKHPRVNILQPGPGVGGHCISVDPWFLVGDYPGLTNLILTARKTNDSMPSHVLNRISEIMIKNNINDISTVGIYGMTYKEDVDDTRESPTFQLLDIMKKNLAYGVKVFDPLIKEKRLENQVMNFNDFLDQIKIIVIITAHSHIKENIELIKGKVILDTKNICHFEDVYKL